MEKGRAKERGRRGKIVAGWDEGVACSMVACLFFLSFSPYFLHLTQLLNLSGRGSVVASNELIRTDLPTSLPPQPNNPRPKIISIEVSPILFSCKGEKEREKKNE